MKALTVQQPWAWAIIHGGKDIEMRSRSLSYRGPLLIHSAKAPLSMDKFDRICRYCKEDGVRAPEASDFRFGGIIGVVDLIDVVTEHASRWFENDSDKVGLLLKNRRPLPFTPMKGQLGLWNVEELPTDLAKHI
jgi:hypothetical protein